MTELFNRHEILQDTHIYLYNNYHRELYSEDEIEAMPDIINIRHEIDTVEHLIMKQLKDDGVFEPIYVGLEFGYKVATFEGGSIDYMTDVVLIDSINKYYKYQMLNSTCDYYYILMKLYLRPNGGIVIGK